MFGIPTLSVYFFGISQYDFPDLYLLSMQQLDLPMQHHFGGNL